jgi:hypothetical protein
MGMNALSASTRRSRISSTISRTSTLPPHHTFRLAPAPPTNKKGRRSSSSSRRNTPAFGPSEPSSTWLRTMTSSSKGSMKTHRSPPTQTGGHSHGDPCHNGKNRRQQMTRHQHSHQPASVSSSAPHSKRCHSYNPRAEESDYNNNETPEIGDIHRDEVYNNID